VCTGTSVPGSGPSMAPVGRVRWSLSRRCHRRARGAGRATARHGRQGPRDDAAGLGEDRACGAPRAHAGPARARPRERRGLGRAPWRASEEAPSAGRKWPWQWVFPATRTYVEHETGEMRRHHLHEPAVQHAVRRAVLAPGIPKRATCHTFRHSFATRLPQGGQRHPYGRSCSATGWPLPGSVAPVFSSRELRSLL